MIVRIIFFIGVDNKIEPIFAKKIKNCNNIYLVCSDGMKLPFFSSFSDFIISHLGFNYIANPLKAFKEIYRVLRKKGKILFTSTVFKRPPVANIRKAHQNKYVTAVAIKDINYLLEKSKFKNIKIEEIIRDKFVNDPYDNDGFQSEGEEYRIIFVSAEK